MPTRKPYSTSARRTTATRTFGGYTSFARSGGFGTSYGTTGGGYGATRTTGYGATRTGGFGTTARFGTAGATTWPTSSPQFATVRDECAWRIGSYRNIYSQVSGSGATPAFSPTIARRWLKFVNAGTPVYQFSPTQFARFFGTQFNTQEPTTAFRWLRNKYGAGIKAVTRGKGGVWLVAATPRVAARPFRTYSWT